jgi:DNA polymerase-3 subunit beta
MKFIVSSTTLLKNLQIISGVINSSNTLPILDDFLFELDGTNLKVTASDLETTLSVNISLTNASEAGSITIPAKMLMEALKTFSEIPLTFTTNDDFSIEISTGEGKYKLVGQSSELYPKTPVIESPNEVAINSVSLSNAINKTLFATGNDELRPAMTGVFFQLEEDNLTFVATDAHKLVRYKRLDVKVTEPASFIMPKKPLNLLKNTLASNDTDVKIEYNNTNASFNFENVNMICRLIDGKFPNYEAVIPTNNTKKLIVDRPSLLSCIRRVALFANQSTRQIRFKVTGQELVLTAEDRELANEARERLSCNFDGEDIEIGFNSKFVLEMLNNIDSDNILIEMSAPNRAALLLPNENEDKQEDLLMLVMPVML